MDVQRNETGHRFEVQTGDGMAVLEYAEPRPGVLDLQHTEVPRGARGGGVGDALVRGALEYARDHGEKIIPTCPYVASWLGRHPDYRDLVAE
ncbi:MAG TPA: GNAT family N-acetyltransferase [Longimicrobiales bacterium]